MQPIKDAHFPKLDALRGFAILSVLSFHFAHSFFPVDPEVKDWNPFLYGWSGVDLFFVVSGFLIARGLLQSKARPYYFRRFYFRRFLRIVPLYYALLAFSLLLLPLLHPALKSVPEVSQQQPYFWLFGVNFLVEAQHGWPGYSLAPLWSLSLEEQFYLICPALIWLLNSRHLRWFAWAAVGVASALRIYLGTKTGYGFLGYTCLLSRMDCLFAGVLIAIARTEGKTPVFARKWVLGLAAIFFALAVGLDGSLSPTGQFMQDFGFPANLLVAAWLVVWATEPGPAIPLSRGLSWLSVPGKFCFSLYLLHQPLLAVVKALVGKLDLSFANTVGATIPLWLGVCFLVSWVSWNYFEAPILIFGKAQWNLWTAPANEDNKKGEPVTALLPQLKSKR